jgi:spore germination protein YaaH
MTYDQQRADIKLNESKAGQPYFPNSDPDWVEKVVEHTVKELPNEKLMLGIPTYGRHMAVTVAPNWFQNYQGLGAVNPPQALALAKKHKVKPSVNRAGEQSVTYFPKEMKRTLRKKIEKLKVDSDVTSGMKAAMQALAYADKTGETVTVNMVWWSDADAIEDKVNIAKAHNLRGVAVFKIDGQEDAAMWNSFK